jgi:hypothetical protein
MALKVRIVIFGASASCSRVYTNVSEEHTTSIFRVEGYTNRERRENLKKLLGVFCFTGCRSYVISTLHESEIELTDFVQNFSSGIVHRA